MSNSNRNKEFINGNKKPLMCIGCNRQCGLIFETEKLCRDKKYRCICPCGNKTFVVSSSNDCKFIPSADLDIEDILEDESSSCESYIIKLSFRKN